MEDCRILSEPQNTRLKLMWRWEDEFLSGFRKIWAKILTVIVKYRQKQKNIRCRTRQVDLFYGYYKYTF